jgi:hypothetical protein
LVVSAWRIFDVSTKYRTGLADVRLLGLQASLGDACGTQCIKCVLRARLYRRICKRMSLLEDFLPGRFLPALFFHLNPGGLPFILAPWQDFRLLRSGSEHKQMYELKLIILPTGLVLTDSSCL